MPFCCFKSKVFRFRFDFFCKYMGFVDKKQEKKGIKKGYILFATCDIVYCIKCYQKNISLSA